MIMSYFKSNIYLPGAKGDVHYFSAKIIIKST